MRLIDRTVNPTQAGPHTTAAQARFPSTNLSLRESRQPSIALADSSPIIAALRPPRQLPALALHSMANQTDPLRTAALVLPRAPSTPYSRPCLTVLETQTTP